MTDLIYYLTLAAAISGAITFVLHLTGAGKWLWRQSKVIGFHIVKVFSAVLDEQPRLRWFTRRDEATPDMRNELGKFSRLAFLGVSHAKLQGYLCDKLNENPGTPLPWQSIDVYFASKHIGSIWEGDAFTENAKKYRQEIAAVLTSPCWSTRLPNSFEVRFHEYMVFFGYSGSMFFREDQEGFHVIYVVQSLPERADNLPKSLTFKMKAEDVSTRNKVHQAVWDHHQEAYAILKQTSRHIGCFRRSLWDESAADWAAFSSREAILGSTRFLTQFLKCRRSERILDLAAGSGHTAKVILDENRNIDLTVLDASPQMLLQAKAVLGGMPNVDFCLCQVPTSDEEAIDIRKQEFSTIVVHRSLRCLASDTQSLGAVARWCHRRLKPHGRLVIAAHNGTIQIPPAQSYANWADPFRPALLGVIRADAAASQSIRPAGQQRMLTEQDVENVFSSSGFECSKKESRDFPLTMHDRRAMWRVPAILDSLVDVRALGLDRGRSFVDKAAASLLDQPTMDMQFVFWMFTKRE